MRTHDKSSVEFMEGISHSRPKSCQMKAHSKSKNRTTTLCNTNAELIEALERTSIEQNSRTSGVSVSRLEEWIQLYLSSASEISLRLGDKFEGSSKSRGDAEYLCASVRPSNGGIAAFLRTLFSKPSGLQPFSPSFPSIILPTGGKSKLYTQISVHDNR